MRWSAWQSMRAGAQVLSGTSLALAVGCAGGEPTISAEKMRPMGLAAIEQVEDAAAEARRRPRYEPETALASVATPVEATPPTGDAPWFLRPAGQAQAGFVQEAPPVVSNTGVSVPPSPIVRPEPSPPVQTVTRPPRPRGGWGIRAACGRG